MQVRGSLTKPGVLSQYGCDPISICDRLAPVRPMVPDSSRRHYCSELETRTQMLLDLIATRRFDLLIRSFSEKHVR